MKKLMAVAACILISTTAANAKPAAKEGFDFLGSNPGFLHKYLQCGPMRSATIKRKTDAEKTCEEKTAIKYCDWADKLPVPIQKKVETDLACDFMAGQMKGDNSPNDAEVLESIKIAGCLELASKSVELMREYFGKENEMRAILFFASDYTDEEIACAKAKAEPKKEEPAKDPVKAEEPKKEEAPKEPAKPEEPKSEDAKKSAP